MFNVSFWKNLLIGRSGTRRRFVLTFVQQGMSLLASHTRYEDTKIVWGRQKLIIGTATLLWSY